MVYAYQKYEFLSLRNRKNENSVNTSENNSENGLKSQPKYSQSLFINQKSILLI